ncbi:MAG: hypothetical protein ABI760_17035 [Ferruginibacter sp.]
MNSVATMLPQALLLTDPPAGGDIALKQKAPHWNGVLISRCCHLVEHFMLMWLQAAFFGVCFCFVALAAALCLLLLYDLKRIRKCFKAKDNVLQVFSP